MACAVWKEGGPVLSCTWAHVGHPGGWVEGSARPASWNPQHLNCWLAACTRGSGHWRQSLSPRGQGRHSEERTGAREGGRQAQGAVSASQVAMGLEPGSVLCTALAGWHAWGQNACSVKSAVPATLKRTVGHGAHLRCGTAVTPAWAERPLSRDKPPLHPTLPPSRILLSRPGSPEVTVCLWESAYAERLPVSCS